MEVLGVLIFEESEMENAKMKLASLGSDCSMILHYDYIKNILGVCSSESSFQIVKRNWESETCSMLLSDESYELKGKLLKKEIDSIEHLFINFQGLSQCEPVIIKNSKDGLCIGNQLTIRFF